MEEVTVTRDLPAPKESVVPLVEDTRSFMDAAGFDAVRVEDETIRIQNRVGLFDVELIVEVVDEDDAVLAYEQVDGIFDEMHTAYHLTASDRGTTISATTRFRAVDLPIVGQVLDATVVKRQRNSELDTQFDWLESQLGDEGE
jgi:hypothetical protein